ncbi:MAG TPA: ABC transporter permease [Trebonia sp.]|jgi:peptide/nickel transport system permease protein|nr:ABC transporter permease [Trebonia sp.]
MLKWYLLRRLRDIVLVLVLVTFFATSLIDLMPGNPVLAIYGSQLTPQFIASFDQEFGLNKPLLVRYGDWVWQALHGNLGVSYQTHFSVASQLAQGLPVTAELAILALLVSLVIAIPLALLAATRPGSVFDRVVTGGSSVAQATPPFVAGLILVLLLAVKAKWLPSQSWVPLTQDVGQNLQHAILPVLVLVLVVAPIFIRILRADVVSVLSENFVAVARSRGLPEWYVLLRHVLRPASASLITVAGISFGALLGGSIVVEKLFSLSGIGLLASNAVYNKDLPVIQGVVVCTAIVFVIINSLVDLSYGLLDPRVRTAR